LRREGGAMEEFEKTNKTEHNSSQMTFLLFVFSNSSIAPSGNDPSPKSPSYPSISISYIIRGIRGDLSFN
jgi:hypothetical protein